MATILITDDSSFSRRIIKKTIATTGHDIIEAANGIECIEQIKQHDPDVLFLDLVMPEMDGFETLKELQRLNIKIPTIVLTADIQDGVAKKCMDLGALAYLNKPPKQDELLAALNLAL
ncbi:MAG: response regulator [Mariprofundaceae bacterium]